MIDVEELKSNAAREMAHATELDYDKCKDLISLFLADSSDALLYRLEIDKEGAVVTKKLSNIIRTKGDLDEIDLMEALATLIGNALAHSPMERILNAVHGGLFCVKVFRKATTIKLRDVDAAIIVAMYRLGAKSLSVARIEAEMKKLDMPEGVRLSPSGLGARLKTLKALGCIVDQADGWSLAETVRRV